MPALQTSKTNPPDQPDPLPAVPPHLIIAFAICASDAWLPTMKSLPAASTRNTQALLRGLKRVQGDTHDLHSLSPPHERTLALAQGLATAETPDGLIAWAAREAQTELGAGQGKAWAWVTPCHWAMGREHATMTDPGVLRLAEQESRTLLAAMQPYFETDGIRLHYLQPDRWLAEGELFRTLPTASLDRVLGRNVDAWLPDPARSVPREAKSGGASVLRRLQNEMQMLLYTHAVNDERAARRQLPVNSFWLSGTGALQGAATTVAGHAVTLTRCLAQPVFNDDWAAYAQAWAALDAGDVAQWLDCHRAGETVRLTLCGERGSETFESSRQGLLSKTSNFLISTGILASQPIWNGREQL